MDLNEFKKSDLLSEIMELYVNSKSGSTDDVYEKYHLTKLEKEELIRQLSMYHDELFFHSAMYEISYMEDVPTTIRIMDKFDICSYFANYLLDSYLEMI